MDRLNEIIQELNEQGRYIPNEGLSEETAQIIITLLRAGAEMRKGYKYSQTILQSGVYAWDAALEERV